AWCGLNANTIFHGTLTNISLETIFGSLAMAANNPERNPRPTEQPRVFRSLREWKENYFPELVKQDEIEELRKDSEKLATALANETLNRVMRSAHQS
ncbi:MAG: hypothetical protein ACREWG_02525, partial [Gammaproteobacteria bacterium]